MSHLRTVSFLLLFISLLAVPSLAQTFDGTWSCNYSTTDDDANGTGYNTISVGVVNENNFVALISTSDGLSNYLVEYLNADSVNGKKSNIPYGADYYRHWLAGFDDIGMYRAMDLYATPDSLIYVANNDPQRNILVFQLGADSVISAPYRIATNADSLWAIHVDDNGYVYVTSFKDAQTPGKVMVFKGIKDDMDSWGTNFTTTPITEVTVPEAGDLRGITTNSDGSILYVSNYTTKKIYCYTGSPSTGYTQNTGFKFQMDEMPIASSGDTLNPGPWGLGFMNTKNILFAAADVDFQLGVGYEYGRIYALNPNTGDILDTIDCAKWNLDQTGGYNLRQSGVQSGYTSTFNVAFDENFNVYDQSYYGWTVDKWSYSGTLPTIPITITGIKKESNLTPANFNLSQNYPNPFNPTTTIKFSLNKSTNVTLSVYDINGQLVSNLINNSHFDSGVYNISFDATKLASGTYIYVLRTNTEQLSRKMTLIK